MLQLTFIPAKYWALPAMKFERKSQDSTIRSNSSFFLFWIDENSNIDDIDRAIQQTFPSIPYNKLPIAQILLAVPYTEKVFDTALKYLKLVPIMGRICPIPPLIKILFQLSIADDTDRSHRVRSFTGSIKTWAYLTKLSFELLLRGSYVPILEELRQNLHKDNEDIDKEKNNSLINTSHEPKTTSTAKYEGKWRCLLRTYGDFQRFNIILQNSAWSAYNLAVNVVPPQRDEVFYKTNGIWHPSYLFSLYMDTVADYFIRSSIDNSYQAKFAAYYNTDTENIDNACQIEPALAWDFRFLATTIGKNRIFEIHRFCDTPIPNVLRSWIQTIQGFPYNLGLRLVFRLEYPKTQTAEWNVGFYLQPLHLNQDIYPITELWTGFLTHQEEFANVCEDENLLQEELLRALGTAAHLFPPFKRALESKNPNHVKLVSEEVMEFLRQGQYVLIQAGYHVILPEEFAQKGQQRLTARMMISSKSKSQKSQMTLQGGGTTSLFSMDSMLEYHWEAQLEGKPLTDAEFQELANITEPILFWRGQWILIDPVDMETLRPIFAQKNRNRGKISFAEAVRLGLNGEIQLGELGQTYEITLDYDFQNLIDQISSIGQLDKLPALTAPSTFQGQLRPYQRIALTWLTYMSQLNFGLCLADDMGLGKTIEIISFLLYRREISPELPGSILIICPTSVLFNWRRELRKFAPDLEVLTHHGSNRFTGDEALRAFVSPHRIILTTYGTIRNDFDLFAAISFAGLILDESQNVKNWKTQQAQAVMQLHGQFRIALSGTPIENRLLELWTLFQFLNPSLLGTRAEFQRRFILPIERFRDEVISQRLKRFISPFILRRLKTDPTIIQDLPVKNEIKLYIELTDVQKTLYDEIVKKTIHEIESLKQTQRERRGLILRLLLQTKQICNHPFQYLHVPLPQEIDEEIEGNQKPEPQVGDNNTIAPQLEEVSINDFINSSTKMERLMEMLEEILTRGEKVIIFTQFKQMGDIIKYIIEKQFDFSIGWLHGGVPERQRAVLVDDFQSSALESIPILLLSLRAGGTGLNLTKATTVIHFDRWWNPAVENQATDRAYRIGQRSQVNVYKFITLGTIEEKIDQMLEEKRALTEQLLTAGTETWISSLSNAELKDLFSLSSSGSEA